MIADMSIHGVCTIRVTELRKRAGYSICEVRIVDRHRNAFEVRCFVEGCDELELDIARPDPDQ